MFVQGPEPAAFDDWDLLIVADEPVGAAIEFTTPFDHSYPGGTFCWPLLFGRPDLSRFGVTTNYRGRFEAAVNFDKRAVRPTSYDSFEGYALGAHDSLEGGEGWVGPWVAGEVAA